MPDDFIPGGDAEFDQFQQQFVSIVAANPSKYGLFPEEVTGLQADQTVWNGARKDHVQAQEDAITATQNKKDAREKFEGSLRKAARKVHGSASVTNGLRAAVGLRPRDETRSPIGAPNTRPLGRIELKGRGAFVLHFVDEATPTRLAKPYGVLGCQIWAFVGEVPPRDPSGYAFLALDTRTPYTHEHAAVDAGKNIHYLLRWQNAKGETGPWSDVITAKVPL